MADAEYLLRNHVVKCQELGMLPIATPQTYNWDNQSYPSAGHVDCQSYVAFIVGNKGILYYTLKDYDLISTIDVTHLEVFNAAANVADEVLNSQLKDVILHGQHTYYALDRNKYYGTWEYNNQFYVMAVNGNISQNISYDIPIPQHVIGSAINLFPNRPDSLSLNGSMLSGELAPYQVAIYKMQTTLSTNDNKRNELLKLFPNPARNTFKISGLNANCKVEILDFAGRKVSTSIVNPHNIEINIQSLQKGAYLVYIVSVDNDNLIQTLKLIKE